MSKLTSFVAACTFALTVSSTGFPGSAGYGPAMDPDGRTVALPDAVSGALAGAGYGPAMDPDGRTIALPHGG